MTKINQAEYDALNSFDQALVWSIVTLAEANRSPANSDLLDNQTVRPEAIEFVQWQVQRDSQSEPYLSFSTTFPLVDHNPLMSSAGLPTKIPNYTNYQPAAEPATISGGQGLPKPIIPAEIDTLERLTCWLCLIADQLDELITYCNAINTYNFLIDPFGNASGTSGSQIGRPVITIDSHGLSWTKPISESEVYANRGASGGGTSSGEQAFAAFDGTTSNPNTVDLAEKLDEAREQQRSNSEPPQIEPGKGYDRIDTLPVCNDQNPKIKAFNKPLYDLLK
jgi:hypothetical protein